MISYQILLAEQNLGKISVEGWVKGYFQASREIFNRVVKYGSHITQKVQISKYYTNTTQWKIRQHKF